jgi:superfamily I DNA/RNA helicase/mRNA-degrading endonuclease RelE of RelBE toxin-antitoxin system
MMEFRIADTFTDSLAKLTGQEQKIVKTTAFDLQLNPSNPGIRFHKLDRAKDPNFWSVSVNMDIRIIVHRTDTSLLLCYVDHHNDAYTWARRRKIERHPKTGAAQLVEVKERFAPAAPWGIEEITLTPAPQPAPVPQAKPLFSGIGEEDLLSYGVPPEWLTDVLQSTEDTLFDIAEHLPQEAAEALLELATGGKPQPATRVPATTDPFSHPDAQRRFRVMSNVEELERALNFPWEKWTVFLHPAQRHLVEREYNGPARVSGSAGTGKTIVALHRAVFLARQHSKGRVLLTTFSEALANALRIKLDRLMVSDRASPIGNEPTLRERIQVHSIRGFARDLYTQTFGDPQIATPDHLRQLLKEAAQIPDYRFSPTFLWGEWTEIVDAWQLNTWEDYRDVQRLGRKTRIGGKQREALWLIFHQVKTQLDQQNLITWPRVFLQVTDHLLTSGEKPFNFAIVDEAQDMGIPELKLLATLGKPGSESLFFTGDLGQRIFQQPFSWKALGIDIRGRSNTLRINYRTSHQIRQQADRLLPVALTDVDGNTEERQGTVSVFNGPPPDVQVFDDPEEETQAVGQWISERLSDGIQPEEIGIFVRSSAQIERAIAAVKHSGASSQELDDQVEPPPNCIAISTMHLAKGLEFRAVAVMACDDEILPLQERIESISDESDLEEVYNTERHLLYVACTRARDHLMISGVDPASEFLDDLGK